MHYPEPIPLEDYERPAGPAVNQLENWYQTLRKKVLDRDSEVSVTEDQLSKASIESIRSFTAEPDCAYLFESLDKAYLPWLNGAATDDPLQLLVFPPCDHFNRVEQWARRNDMDVLEAPDRSALLSMDSAEVLLPVGSGPLVIPKLEDWFIRHQCGLRHVRTLLAALQNTSRPCLVSCSSWTWIFLKKAVNADLVLPAPQSLAPFDAENLGNWLLALLAEESNQPVVFRDYADGKEILRDDKDGTNSRDFMQQLAGDSGGIPWIAWQLWRRSLRTKAEKDGENSNSADDGSEPEEPQKSENGAKVFWVVRNLSQTLPRGHERAACLLLQALLIHGSLPEKVLSSLIPSVGESNLIVALIRSGFIERHDDDVRCLAAAYPAIWKSLTNAGMPMPPF